MARGASYPLTSKHDAVGVVEGDIQATGHVLGVASEASRHRGGSVAGFGALVEFRQDGQQRVMSCDHPGRVECGLHGDQAAAAALGFRATRRGEIARSPLRLT